MLIALAASVWFYRYGVITFLITSFVAYCQDQNRGQPWLYMYWVMLLLSLFPAPSALAACRVAVSVVYVWSGIQKMNERFLVMTPEWFVAPAVNWHFPEILIVGLRFAVKMAPYIELAIGVLLWIPRLRKVAFVAVFLVHLGAILFLGPWGHNYNWVVWPWNLAMIALVMGLFARGKLFEESVAPAEPSKLKPQKGRAPAKGPAFATISQTFAELRKSRAALIVVLLYALLPILSYSGRWDSYFSFALYSENLATANIFVSESFRDQLPPGLRKYVQPFPQFKDPQRQSPFIFGYGAWAYEEMHVPPISEPRNFLAIYSALLPYARQPSDLRMLVGPRSGMVVFREGERIEYLPRSQ